MFGKKPLITQSHSLPNVTKIVQENREADTHTKLCEKRSKFYDECSRQTPELKISNPILIIGSVWSGWVGESPGRSSSCGGQTGAESTEFVQKSNYKHSTNKPTSVSEDQRHNQFHFQKEKNYCNIGPLRAYKI